GDPSLFCGITWRPLRSSFEKKKNRQLRLAVWFEYSGFVSFESSSALPPVATESVVKPKPIADREEIHGYLITQDPERAQIGGPVRHTTNAKNREETGRLQFAETQRHRRPGGGRDPGKKRRARRAEAYRGRGAVSLLPALRTVRAVLPHTALRSVVIYIEIGAQERELAIG